MPPSRVRLTTSFPSTGTRRSSFVAGTNHAVSGWVGWTATANPNPLGAAFGTYAHVRAPSADLKTPLWC